MSAASPLGWRPGRPHHVVHLCPRGHRLRRRATPHLGSRRAAVVAVAALAGALLVIVALLVPVLMASIATHTNGPTPSPRPVVRLG